MKQGFLRIVVMMTVVLLSCANLWAENSGKCGDNLTWTLDDNGVLTISGMGDMDSYNYNDSPWKNYHLEKVVINEGVIGIGDYAFYGCSSLKSIVMPNSVTKIGSSAFRGLSGVTSVMIPNGVTSIGSSAFRDCI